MKFKIKGTGFSLTELLIVLVIIAVLFAAMAPIIAKRGQGSSSANESVWNFVNNAKDAYYDPGVPGLTSAAYFGINPINLSSDAPQAKVYVRANEDQNHIQFRYGDNYGTYTGVFSADDGYNMLLTSAQKFYPSYSDYENGTTTDDFSDRGYYNTIAGIRAYQIWNNGTNNIGMGANSLTLMQGGLYNIAIGANTGQYLNGSNNIFIGANTGRGKVDISNTVAIGGRILSIDESSGDNNVFIGYGVATAGFSSSKAKNNTIIGSNMYGGETAANNTIIGYGTYDANFENAKNITAAGYNACSSIQMSSYSNQGPKTCIGYRSADTYGASSYSTSDFNWADDIYDHVFLGGAPIGFNGRSVLEVHNMKSTPSLGALPKMGPTVVLNSNLVVRGNLYFPYSDTGILAPHLIVPVTYNLSSTEKSHDRCGRKCLGGRKKFRTGRKCSGFWNLVLTITSTLIGSVITIASLGSLATGVGTIIYLGLWGGGFGYSYSIGQLFQSDSDTYSRSKEPPTASVMNFAGDTDSKVVLTDCMSGSESSYPTHEYCPDLKLSDIRLKENITENTDGLDKIMYVMPYKYTFKNDKTKTPQTGVTAQELREYLPDSVFEGKDGYLGIQWDGMFYAVINSIKSLDKSVETLISDISGMEADTSALAKEQKTAQKRIDELDKRIKKLEK